VKTISNGELIVQIDAFHKLATEKSHMVPITSRKAICRLVISYMEDMLGGDGWDDPKLVSLIESWIGWPFSWEDQVIDPAKEATTLVNDSGLDPRHLLDKED
jgi:hypothetical protein